MTQPSPENLRKAAQAMERSYALARRCGLRRQEYSAAVALGLLRVRFGVEVSDSRPLGRLNDEYADVVAGDEGERLRLLIGSLLERLLSAGIGGINDIISEFDEVGGGTSGTGLVARMQAGARVNARVLEAWRERRALAVDAAGNLSPLLGRDDALSHYWRHRLKVLCDLGSPTDDGELQGMLWHLLDPQPPNPPKPGGP